LILPVFPPANKPSFGGSSMLKNSSKILLFYYFKRIFILQYACN